MALFDLAAKIAEKPLYRYLSDRFGDGQPDDSVFVYAAGGYYAPGKTIADLQDEMRRFLDEGYSVVKMKIGGADLAEDLKRIALAQEILDSVVAERAAPPLSEANRQELQRRLAEHTANPNDVIPWEQMEAEALERFRK